MTSSAAARRSGLWIVGYMLLFNLSQQTALLVVIQRAMSKGFYSFEQASQFVLDNQGPLVMAVSALIGLPLLFLVVFLRGLKWHQVIRQGKVLPGTLGRLLLLGMAMNLLAGIILTLLGQVPIFSSWIEAHAEAMNMLAPAVDPRQMILLVGIVVPIYEEVLFRGLVFREMRHILPVNWAIILQALLFGVWHASLIQGIYAFLLALVMGRVYLRYQSIWGPIAVHCGFNSASYLLLYLV